MKHGWKKAAGLTLIILLVFFWQMYGVRRTTILMSVEQAFEDLIYRRPTGVTQNIKIIGVDEETLQSYGRLEDWLREGLAELIGLLSENPETAPAVIGLDFLLTGEMQSNAETDERLVQVCTEAGNVVMAANLVYRTEIGMLEDGSYYSDKWNVELLECAFPALERATQKGFVNALQDKDGIIRRARLRAECQGEEIKSFPYVIAENYLQLQNLSPLQTEENVIQFLYSGKPGEYEKVSFLDVLNGEVDLRAFRDAIVLVGAYAPAMQDAYHVAVERGEQMYGVEIHANVIESLLSGKVVRLVPELLVAALTSVIFAAYFLLGQKQKLWLVLTEGCTVMVLWLLTGILLRPAGWLLTLSVVELGMPLLMLYFIIKKYIMERIGRKRILKAFKRYVAPQVVKELGNRDSFEIRLGGERKEIAVLFVDIRGFTSMSEKLAPEQVVEILNEYLNLTSQAIFKNHGTLDKFIGDATMAVFNAPVDLDDYVYKAVCAAWDMVQETRTLQKKIEERFGQSVQFGIGVNCGPAIVGNIGSEQRMDYTAIGDTVNTAARLEGQAKQGEILISRTVYEAVQGRIEAEPVGELELKGKAQKTPAFRLLGIKKQDEGETE